MFIVLMVGSLVGTALHADKRTYYNCAFDEAVASADRYNQDLGILATLQEILENTRGPILAIDGAASGAQALARLERPTSFTEVMLISGTVACYATVIGLLTQALLQNSK